MVTLRTHLETYLAGWRDDLNPAWRSLFGEVEPDFGAVPLELTYDAEHPVIPPLRSRPLPGAPAGAHIFRAFDGVVPDAVRVVLIGQDPYPRASRATGRAFEDGALAGWQASVAISLQRLMQSATALRYGEPDFARTPGDWQRVRAAAAAGDISLEPLGAYFDTIHRAFESLPISYSAELWAEPGRALCAEYSSLIVRVERRRDDELFINDGAYGALFDAAHLGWQFPVRLLREPDSNARDMAFSFYGPTCDDMDHMAGPFMLPADIRAGDYIEIGMLGAYGAAMRTGFNGFTNGATVIVDDEPMVSLYEAPERHAASANVVTL